MTKTIQFRFNNTDYDFVETNKSLAKWAVEDMGIIKESLAYSKSFEGRIYTGNTATGREITFWKC